MLRFILLGTGLLCLFFGPNGIFAEDNDKYPCEHDYGIVFSYLTPMNYDFWYICNHSGSEPEWFFEHFDAVSPNHIRAATVDYSSDSPQLNITSLATGERILTLPWESSWLSYGIRWLNEDQLAIPISENTQTAYEGDLLVIDLSSGIERRIIDVSPPIPANSDFETFSYSPTLSHYVYSANTPNSPSLILVQRIDDQILWQTPLNVLHPPSSYTPAWSNSGAQFVYTRFSDQNPLLLELFLVDNLGEEFQLSDFSSSRSFSNILYMPTWSPDDNYVAFWYASTHEFMTLDEGEDLNLAVIDVRTSRLTNFDVRHSNVGTFDIVWSPDSRFIATISTNEKTEQLLTIIDTELNAVYTIQENVADIAFWR